MQVRAPICVTAQKHSQPELYCRAPKMPELVAELKKLSILFPTWLCGEQTAQMEKILSFSTNHSIMVCRSAASVNAAEKIKDVVRLI